MTTKVIIRDLKLDMIIGIHAHEKVRTQPVIVNVEAVMADDGIRWTDDDYSKTVCYESLVNGIQAIAAGGPVGLVETFAEKIASLCLKDPRIGTASVRVEKPDAISDAEAVGVEIRRARA